MGRNFGYRALATLAMLVGTVGVSQAVVLTVVANHKAGPPITSQPSGTGSVTAARVYPSYQVKVDFGTLSGGNFTLWNQSPTGTVTVTPDP